MKLCACNNKICLYTKIGGLTKPGKIKIHFHSWFCLHISRDNVTIVLIKIAYFCNCSLIEGCKYEIESKSNLNILIKRQWLELERCLLLHFSQGSHCQSKCTCSSTHTTVAPKYSGELIFGNSAHDPYQAHLEAVLGQWEPRQLWLHSWKEKKSGGVISSE